MPEPFSTVLLDELRVIDLRRVTVFPAAPPPPEITGDRPSENQALERNLTGMGISGGGIRSATFNLGILQGLAEHGLLPHLDYLSTVSGGGYIGSWLHGLTLRLHGGNPKGAGDRLSPQKNPVPGEPVDDPVSFLRKYSNYLAPRFSLFSTDLWVIGAIWVRNMLLNWCVLVPFLAACLLLPVLGGLLHQGMNTLLDHQRLFLIGTSFLAALVLLSVAVLTMATRLREVAERTFNVEPPGTPQTKADAGLCAALVFLAGVLMGGTPTRPLEWYWWGKAVAIAALLLLFFVLQVKGGFRECYRSRRDSDQGATLWVFLMSLGCAAVTAVLLITVLNWMSGWHGPARAWGPLAFGPPLVLAALAAGVSLLIGLMGVDYPDAAREWVSRLGALLSIGSVAWMAVFCLGVYAPLWIAILFATWWKTAVAGVGGWAATSAVGIFAGHSGKTTGTAAESNGPMEVIAKIAPPVFMIGILAFMSFGLHWGIREFVGKNQPNTAPNRQKLTVKLESSDGNGIALSANQPDPIRISVPAAGTQKLELESKTDIPPAWTTSVIDNHWAALEPSARLTLSVLGAVILLSLLMLLFARRININEFSMHHFYKNRLVRCYLGASKGHGRQANPWTGFDPQDDFPLRKIHAREGYYGPYPIVNTAVNIDRGSELAKQERKAESFFFTPLYCGFSPEHSDEDLRALAADPDLSVHGYRATNEFGGKGGPSLGSAMAISGAAANPNMGYHTSASIAFLLTMFNVRLGWWVGNPRRDKPSARPGPSLSLLYLLSELTGQTDDRSAYLSLSDGGHFENLGLYELIRRRCRFIIIGDGEQDASLTFGSLAGAIRKCQTDFGVTIDLDVHSIQETDGLSRAHCVIGTINYPEKDPTGAVLSEYGTGLLLYFKASLTGDEPEDVREFRSRFAEFPHQSTGDQFFTEAQFESYRNLGLHIARTALRGAPGDSIQNLFGQLRRDWSPPPVVADGIPLRLSAAYSALLHQLKQDSDLQYLDAEIVPGLPTFAGEPSADARRKGFLYCLDCIRFAESVYQELNFRELSQRENRGNQGWVTIFRYWAAQPHIREVWKAVSVTVNPPFRQFFQSMMDTAA